LKPEDYSPSYMTWHLKDTSKLEAVGVQVAGPDCDVWEVTSDETYWESMQTFLKHLALEAPVLRSLDLGPPRPSTEGDFVLHSCLPLVGVLSRLESLTLRDWWYSADDIDSIASLTGLQNLKVPSLT